MRTIRAIIAELPRFETEIIRDALVRHGIEVAAEVVACDSLESVVESTRSDLIVIPFRRAPLAAEYHELLRQYPGVRLMMLTADRDGADLFEVRLLGSDVGSDDFVDSVRRALVCAPNGYNRSA